MAEILGPQTILSLALPTGVDATRVTQWQLRSGRSFGQIVQDLALALGDFNQQMMDEWGWLFFITEDLMMEYEDGGADTVPANITDVDKVEARSVTTIGHMIDLLVYGDAIGGTKRWFRDAREAQLAAQTRRVVRAHRKLFEQKLLTRWFTNTDNQVGTSGYDVGWVRGTGGAVDYTPPSYDGETFTSSHNHYLGVASGSYTFGDMLNQLAETVQEHGHQPPYTALVARADVGSYYALAEFVRPVDERVIVVEQGGLSSSINRFFQRDVREFGVIGGFESEYGYIELRASNRVPTGYAGLVKSYGVNNTQNPLAVRVHPDVGFGVYVVTETATDAQYPVKQVNVEFEFGVSVGMDRTVGAAAYRSVGGSWTNPTIS